MLRLYSDQNFDPFVAYLGLISALANKSFAGVTSVMANEFFSE